MAGAFLWRQCRSAAAALPRVYFGAGAVRAKREQRQRRYSDRDLRRAGMSALPSP